MSSRLALLVAILAVNSVQASSVEDPSTSSFDPHQAYNCQRHDLLYAQIEDDLQPWAEGGIDAAANSKALHSYCSADSDSGQFHVCLRMHNGTLQALVPMHAELSRTYPMQTAGVWGERGQGERPGGMDACGAVKDVPHVCRWRVGASGMFCWQRVMHADGG